MTNSIFFDSSQCQSSILTKIKKKNGLMTWAVCGSICAAGLIYNDSIILILFNLKIKNHNFKDCSLYFLGLVVK